MESEQPPYPTAPSPEHSASNALGDMDTTSAPAVFGPVRGDIPSDPESLEFPQALQALKSQFSSRTEFNFMVCDQLALRGVAPNGLNVRKAGSWGAPVAVGADVRAWYTALSARLSSEHASIPEAAKRNANTLFEQLWAQALSGVGEPLRERLAQAEERLAKETEVHARASLDMQQSHAAEIEALQTELTSIRTAKSALFEEVIQVKADLADERRVCNTQADEIRRLKNSIAQAAQDHRTTLQQHIDRHAQALEQLRLQAQENAAAYSREMSSLQKAFQAERARLDVATKAHALSIDGFRVDLRSAVQRGDQAMASLVQERDVASSLREKLGQVDIERARLEASLKTAVDECVSLKRQLEHVAGTPPVRPNERSAPG